MSSYIFAIPTNVMAGSWMSRWKMKNMPYYLVEMEQLIIVAVVGKKLASLEECHKEGWIKIL
jgi:hypothetical protein